MRVITFVMPQRPGVDHDEGGPAGPDRLGDLSTQLVQWAQAAVFAIMARELRLWAHDEAFTAPWLVAQGRWSAGCSGRYRTLP